MQPLISDISNGNQYLDHVDEIKFLHVFLDLNLPYVLIAATEVPVKADLLHDGRLGHRSCKTSVINLQLPPQETLCVKCENVASGKSSESPFRPFFFSSIKKSIPNINCVTFRQCLFYAH